MTATPETSDLLKFAYYRVRPILVTSSPTIFVIYFDNLITYYLNFN